MPPEAPDSPTRWPVAGRDGIWLQDRPANRMMINSVMTVDHLPVDVLRQLWDERVMAVGERYARFRRRIVHVGKKAFWEDDPDFDLSRHIVPAPPTVGNPKALATREALQEYISSIAADPLPEDRAPWRMEVVENFGDSGTAVIHRLHHVIADGMSLLPVIFSLMDLGEGEDAESLIRQMAQKAAKPAGLGAKVAAAVASPYYFGSKVAWKADNSSLHGPELGGTKRVAWTDPFDLERVKALKSALGATVNDVLMACVSGAFERYLQIERGERLDRLRISMPFNVRHPDELPELENKFAAVLLELPTGFDDPRERVMATKRKMDRLKRSPEPLFTYGAAAAMLATLPRRVSGGVIDFLANKTSCVVSNVPGPASPVYVAGRRLRAMLFWVPQRADIGIGVSILSYAGTVRLGVIADTELIPDPNQLTGAFVAELEALERFVKE